MAVKLEGIPQELVSAEVDTGAVSVVVESSLYPLEALYGASYIFIDRCYVFLDKPDATHFKITLASRKPDADVETLKGLVGEFANELLSSAWRAQITQENRAIIESVTSRAIAGAMGPPSFDDLAAFDFTEEPFEDPLGIAQSWEEKYKKGTDAAPAAPAAAAPAAAAVPEVKAS